jgi:hypothetical protein
MKPTTRTSKPLNLYTLAALLMGLSWLWSGCGVDKPEEVVLAEQQLPEKVDFNYDVKPILSDKCFACHGPDVKNREADLRLDTEEGAYAALKDSKNRHSIVPGSLSKSEVYARLVSDDPNLKMPPPSSNLSLSPREVAVLVRWIEQGAEYKPHWSFIKPEKASIPRVKDKKWPKSPIDHFILQRIEAEGMRPAAAAEKADLIRRVSFDLTGLPPTLEEVDRFVADTSPQAYERMVDRLLASPAYGERMASEWMDIARYADSDGYLDDKHRDFSPWRDWVIRAFNANMPYDQFVTWQLAGDQIPGRSKESILATAFNRLHKKSTEAGIIFEEYRVEYNADRVQTLGRGILGLSFDCARCHDHKYDPVSQEDYYKLFGFFNSTDETGSPVYGPDQTPGPALLLTNKETEELAEYLKNEILTRETQQRVERQNAESRYTEWLAGGAITSKAVGKRLADSLVAYFPFDKIISGAEKKMLTPNLVNSRLSASCNDPVLKPGKKGNAFFVNDYNSITVGHKIGWRERNEPFSVSLWINPHTVYPDAGVFYHCEDLRLGLKGYSLKLADNKLQFIIAHSYPQNSIQVATLDTVPTKTWTHVTVTYDGSSKAAGARIYVNGVRAAVTADYDNLYKGILYEKDIHTYGFKGLLLGQRALLLPFKDGGLDELKVYHHELTPLEVLYDFDPIVAEEKLRDPSGVATKQLMREYYLAYFDPVEKKSRNELQIVRARENTLLNSIPEIMVMGDLPKPRPTYVLDRGLYSARDKEVTPGTPEAILPFNPSYPANRLGLTQWIFDEDNPLTARVMVNRIWQMHFGRGLVASAGDFGNQGNLPSHPQLLDWLAVEFQESGWDLKKLHKLIVSSATYQQSSVITSEIAEKDPENILLARGARFRLSAEMIRDHSLSISGLLVTKLGGKSVYPYQPEGLWDELSDKVWRYPYLQEPGEGLYRRSLYTVWKRTAPPPSMLIFDAPERGECAVSRRTTSTPLQALVLLNDPQHIEAARVLAEKLLTEAPAAEGSGHVQKAFRVITGRKPLEGEKAVLEKFYQTELAHFKEKPERALDYLGTGTIPWNRSLAPSETAALATVVNSIMNTDEAVTRK